MPDRQVPEMFIPISDEGAALQFFVEAMKANTSTLQQVGKTLQGMQEEQKETLKLLYDTRERVIRIETNSVNSKVIELEKEVRDLRDDKLQRDGASKLTSAAITRGPIVVTIIVAVITVLVVLVSNGKL